MVYAQPRICLRKWHSQTPMGLWFTNGSPNLYPKTRSYNNQQKNKKNICKIVDFAVLADHRIKLRECEKRDKYLDLARELKKNMEHEGDNYTNCDRCLWHGNRRIIKGPRKIWKLATEWRPCKQQHNWKRSEYWEESWRLEETCCHSIPSEIPSAYADVKNSNE